MPKVLWTLAKQAKVTMATKSWDERDKSQKQALRKSRPMTKRQIRHGKLSLVLSARFSVVKWRSLSVTKSAYNTEDKWCGKLQYSRRVMGRETICLVCDHHSWLSAELTCLGRTCCTLYRQAWWTFGVTALRLHGFHMLFHENNYLICPTKALWLAGCTLDDLLQANDKQCLHANILIMK